MTAQNIFRSAYGDSTPDAGARCLEIDTSVGRCDVIIDPANLRVKVIGLRVADLERAGPASLVAGLGDPSLPYTKLTVYALPGDEMAWVTRGFLREGTLLGFFADGVHADLWALYGDDDRDLAPRDAEHDRIVALAAAKPLREPTPHPELECRIADGSDAAGVSALLRETFSEYPTPLDEVTIRRAIVDGSHLFRLFADEDGGILAVASAEIDARRRSAELTDCATRPEARGRGLVSGLLHRLELDLLALHDIRDLYTIARADEPGMNCAFAALGYIYTGRLVNNCRMPNGWESMNVWCRRAERPAGLDPDADF